MDNTKNVCTLSELKKLEVINLCDGRNLGCVCDVEMDLYQGQISALIVPGRFDWKSVFQATEDRRIRILWHRIERIGSDTILARLPEAVL